MLACFDCDEGPCYMNCGPAQPSSRLIRQFSKCRIDQEAHGDALFYRVISSNDIVLHESASAVSCHEYAEWFEKRNARRS